MAGNVWTMLLDEFDFMLINMTPRIPTQVADRQGVLVNKPIFLVSRPFMSHNNHAGSMLRRPQSAPMWGVMWISIFDFMAGGAIIVLCDATKKAQR